jgi:hypothetical protein
MPKPPKLPSGRGIPLHADSIQFWAEHQKKLRRNLPRWNQFRSSLTAIRQTHRAIEAYNRSNGELSDDQRYLAIYGLLQALVVQQDAMCHLAEALGTQPVLMNRHKRLEEIRNIRNWTVGHPTKIDRYDTHSHHAIKRPQLGRGGFSLYSAFDDGREQYTYVPLLQLARLQRRVVSRLLRDVLRELNTRRQPAKDAGVHKSNSATVSPASQPRPTQHGRAQRRLRHDKIGPRRDDKIRDRQAPDRRGATAYRSPAVQRWGRDKSRPESGRDDTLAARNRQNKSKSVKPAILPLPGERFARQPAA